MPRRQNLDCGSGTDAALALLVAVTPSAASRRRRRERDARMAWWREARFGMFIHWGLYAVPAGEYKGKRSKDIGEWIMSWANIPRADYEKFADAVQSREVRRRASGCAIAKDAGMKYIVITSKHHDGFAMYDSAVSDYDIVDATPYKKDPMADAGGRSEEGGPEVLLLLLDHGLAPPVAVRRAPGKDPTAGNGKTKMQPGRRSRPTSHT